MKKRFKSKKRRGFKFRLILLIIILFLLLYLFNNKKISITDYLSKIYSNKLDLNSESFLVKYSLGLSEKDEDIEFTIQDNGDYMEDPTPNIVVEDPLVYIYNTHQSETYNKNVMEPYNISPTVMMTSYMLREKLINIGIPTIVETGNIKQVLNNNNWIYKDSYKASRILLEKAFKDNPTIKMFIDIHRDSSKYQNTTYNDGSKSYA